jgi:hypothetical protein
LPVSPASREKRKEKVSSPFLSLSFICIRQEDWNAHPGADTSASFNGRFLRKTLQQNSPQEAIMSTLRLV